MKQVLLSLALLCLIGQTFGQKLGQTPTLTKDYYLSKSKTQKTIGWVLLGGGTALITTGIIVGNKKEKNNFDGLVRQAVGVVYWLPGVIIAASSIIPFSSASKNKRKAALISFKNQKVLFLQQNAFASKAQPALVLTIQL